MLDYYPLDPWKFNKEILKKSTTLRLRVAKSRSFWRNGGNAEMGILFCFMKEMMTFLNNPSFSLENLIKKD